MLGRALIFSEYIYYLGRGNWDRELMKKLARLHYDIHAICCRFTKQFEDEERELRELGVKLHLVSFNKVLFVIGTILQAYRILRRQKAVLYTPSLRLIPLFWFLKKIFNVPIILSLQGAAVKEFDTMAEFEKLRRFRALYSIQRKIRALEEKVSATIADRIIVISEAIKLELMSLGIPGDRIDLIYYAIDTNRFYRIQEERERLRSKYAISENEIVINYTARLSTDVPTKMWSAELLIRVMARLSFSWTNLRIMFVGGGDGIEILKQLSVEQNLVDKIIFVGAIPHNQVPHYLSASDVFWFVMRDPLPTYGLALLEAMSCENVVITNNSGSMREIIEDGYNGFLVEPYIDKATSSLEAILRKRASDFNSIGKAARKTVQEKYSWEVVLPGIINVINDLCG